jgi:hypothetical protein
VFVGTLDELRDQLAMYDQALEPLYLQLIGGRPRPSSDPLCERSA